MVTRDNPTWPGERGSVPTEWVVVKIRSHVRRLAVPAVIFIALAGVVPFLLGRIVVEWQIALLCIAAGSLMIIAVLVPYLLWLNRRYTITSRRVIVTFGLVTRTRREVFHSRGYTVTVKRSWIQSLFRSGTIVLSTGVDSAIVMKDVSGSSRIAEALNELVERSQIAGARTARTEVVD